MCGMKEKLEFSEQFSSKEELEKVRKAPKEEKRVKLEEFKEKLAAQKEGIADLELKLIANIRANPDIGPQELNSIIEEMGERFGLTEEQKLITRTILARYRLKHEAVKKAAEGIPDPSDLFKAVFGQAPKGKVEVVQGPMTVYFRCYDLRDYALIRSQAFAEKRVLTERDLAAAEVSRGAHIRKSLIPELEGTIIAENAAKVPENEKPQTLIHEEQHAINHLFKEERDRTILLNEKPAQTRSEAKNLAERYLREQREWAESRAKDEILAYFSTGEEPRRILLRLKPGEGRYDYFREIREREIPFLEKR